MDHAGRDVAGSDGNVASLPGVFHPADLDLDTGERRRRPHDGGADVPTDVQYDRSTPARSGVVFHGYGATETGVLEGFEKPL
jgi:hypothetical protein